MKAAPPPPPSLNVTFGKAVASPNVMLSPPMSPAGRAALDEGLSPHPNKYCETVRERNLDRDRVPRPLSRSWRRARPLTPPRPTPRPPRLSGAALATLAPIGFLHALGHIGAVVSAGAGAVSFTQIVKAAEPVFTCVLSAIVLGQYISMPVAFSLVPIVFGVALASVTELSFTWVAFSGAMLSNLAFALRNILSRASMDKPKGENMTPENLFGVLTIMSFLFALPLALVIEGPSAPAAFACWHCPRRLVRRLSCLLYTSPSPRDS